MLEQLGLWEIRSRSGWGLSGGQKRKTVTAMALATEAEVVFLDEPTTGLDVESRYSVWDAVRSVAAEGRCIVFTTHDMREAGMLADHVVFISRGRVVAEGSPGRLRESLPYRYRVVLRRPSCSPAAARTIRLGDTVIAYTRSRSEAHAIAEDAKAESATVEPVGFEDVYLHYVHEAQRGGGGLVGARGWLGALSNVLGIVVLESRWVVRQPGRLIQDAFMVLSFALIL